VYVYIYIIYICTNITESVYITRMTQQYTIMHYIVHIDTKSAIS